MLSEPVFLIPLLAWMGGIQIQSLIIIIAIFQIMSIFSLQLGKYSPPEYQSGAVAAFILFGMCNMPIAPAIAMGVLFAYLFNAIYNIKLTINERIISSNKTIYLKLITSIITSIMAYFIIYFILWLLGKYSYHFHSSYALIPILLAMAILKTGNIKIRHSGMIIFSISLVTVIAAALWFI